MKVAFQVGVLIISASLLVGGQEVARKNILAVEKRRPTSVQERACKLVTVSHGDGIVKPTPPRLAISNLQLQLGAFPQFTGTARITNKGKAETEIPWCGYDSIESLDFVGGYSYRRANIQLRTERNGRAQDFLIGGGALFWPIEDANCGLHLKPKQWVNLAFQGELSCSRGLKACVKEQEATKIKIIAEWSEGEHEGEFKNCVDASAYYSIRDASTRGVRIKVAKQQKTADAYPVAPQPRTKN